MAASAEAVPPLVETRVFKGSLDAARIPVGGILTAVGMAKEPCDMGYQPMGGGVEVLATLVVLYL